MARPIQTVFRLGLLLALLIFVGCKDKAATGQLTDEIVLEFATLPGARNSTDLALREEIARIELEGATPELLIREVPAEQDGVRFFAELFPKNELQEIAEQSDALMPRPAFQLGPIELERLVRFRTQHETQRQQVRDWLAQSPGPLSVDLRRGPFLDLSFLSAMRVAAQLEAFLATEHLAAGRLEAATDAVEVMLQLDERLAAAPHVTTRLAAAASRRDTLDLAVAVLQHPEADAELAARYQALLAGLLKRWPNDAVAWQGERAVALATYEAIRAGHLLQILTSQEARQFAEENILREFQSAAARGLDADELFYLHAMRRVIESCTLAGDPPRPVPYYLREPVIVEVLTELEALRTSSQFPLVAGRLLLPDVRPASELQANDRARCEALSLALARATGASGEVYSIHPATGKPYQVAVEPQRVTVSGMSDDFLIVLPRFDVRVSRLP